jgi:TonB family protein
MAKAKWICFGALVVLSGGSRAVRARILQDPPVNGGDAPMAPQRRRGPCREGDPGCTVPPRVVYAPSPDYSDKGRKAKVEGTVTLRITVSKDGEPQDITVEKKLGYGLDEEAVKAVKKWKFQAASRDGVPLDQRIVVQVNFRLY